MFSFFRAGALLAVILNPSLASELAGGLADTISVAMPAQVRTAGVSPGSGGALPRRAVSLPPGVSPGFRGLADVVSSAFGLMLGTADVLLSDSGVASAVRGR